MRARDWRCPFTGRPADHLHHPTGRDADGNYFDPSFVVPLVRAQHVAEHQVWERSGVGEREREDSTWLRLRRVALLLVRLADFHQNGTVTLPAASLGQLGTLLLDIATEWINHQGEKQ